jgi:hypothetical protein
LGINKEGIFRKKYIQTLQCADRGDYEPLICLMQELGSSDPTVSEFLESVMYRAYARGDGGSFFMKALCRREDK